MQAIQNSSFSFRLNKSDVFKSPFIVPKNILSLNL